MVRLLRQMTVWRACAVVLAVAATIAAIFAVGALVRGDRPSAAERAAATRREEARLAEQERHDPAAIRQRAELRAEQSPHRGRAPRPGRPTRASQAAITAALEGSITRDARDRFRHHLLDARVLQTRCVHLVRPSVPNPPPPPVDARGAGYECTAETTKGSPAILGFPFLARVDFQTGRYVWCKISRRPAEHGTGVELAFVPLPKVCDVLPGRA